MTTRSTSKTRTAPVGRAATRQTNKPTEQGDYGVTQPAAYRLPRHVLGYVMPTIFGLAKVWLAASTIGHLPTFLMQFRPNDKIFRFFIPANGMIRSIQFVDNDNCLPPKARGSGKEAS